MLATLLGDCSPHQRIPMTFDVYFSPEQAYFGFVKAALERGEQTTGKGLPFLAEGSLCIVALAVAMEAFTNLLFSIDERVRHYDQLGSKARIEVLGLLVGETVNWSAQPWQEIGRVISLRNWLVHYKDRASGLVNSAGDWLADARFDAHGRRPYHRLDDFEVASVRKAYSAVLDGMRRLAAIVPPDKGDWDFSFLTTEKFETLPMW